jgi:hypothetical protein
MVCYLVPKLLKRTHNSLNLLIGSYEVQNFINRIKLTRAMLIVC